MDSILNSIKKLLGIQEEYTHFDADLILDINVALSVLTQIGIGPSTGFTITDEDDTWDDFIGDDPRLEMVKSYVHFKVKMMFDPPTMTSVSEAMNKLLNEYEFRLAVVIDEKKKENAT